MRIFTRAGLFLGVLYLMAGSAWAAPFTGASQGLATTVPILAADGTIYLMNSNTSTGYTTIGGAFQCTTTYPRSALVPEPTGACGMEEIELTFGGHHACQFDGAEDILEATGTGTVCYPFSCFDENRLLLVSCIATSVEDVTVTGGTGVLAGARGSWMISGTVAYTRVEVTEFGGISSTSTFSTEIEGDFELADGSVAPDGAFLEIPSSGTNVSGITVISGWSCLGGELEVEFSDANGVIETVPVIQGSERLDTEGVCDDTDNGFSATYNWNRLGTGERTARLIRNGEEVDSSTFMVTTFDTEFLIGAEGMCTIADFPDMGKNATFVWEQSQQGLVLESVN